MRCLGLPYGGTVKAKDGIGMLLWNVPKRRAYSRIAAPGGSVTGSHYLSLEAGRTVICARTGSGFWKCHRAQACPGRYLSCACLGRSSLGPYGIRTHSLRTARAGSSLEVRERLARSVPGRTSFSTSLPGVNRPCCSSDDFCGQARHDYLLHPLGGCCPLTAVLCPLLAGARVQTITSLQCTCQ